MQNRKEEIRAAAAELFRKKGYGATSMRDIADSVGIKAASIYNHFKGKQELLQDLLMQPAALYTEEMQRVKASGISGRQKLEQLIKHHVKMSVEQTDAVGLIVGEWAHLEGEARREFIEMRNDYEADFYAIIEEGKRAGAFRQDINTDVAVFSILSTLRYLFSWYSRNREFSVSELEQQMVRQLSGSILNTL